MLAAVMLESKPAEVVEDGGRELEADAVPQLEAA